jgi:hypothetical protein
VEVRTVTTGDLPDKSTEHLLAEAAAQENAGDLQCC